MLSSVMVTTPEPPGYAVIEAALPTRLREARLRTALSLEEASECCGLPPSILGAMESGAQPVSAAALYRLSWLYHVPLQRWIEEMNETGEAAPSEHSADADALIRHFLTVDQPNRGQLFKDFLKRNEPE